MTARNKSCPATIMCVSVQFRIGIQRSLIPYIIIGYLSGPGHKTDGTKLLFKSYSQHMSHSFILETLHCPIKLQMDWTVKTQELIRCWILDVSMDS